MRNRSKIMAAALAALLQACTTAPVMAPPPAPAPVASAPEAERAPITILISIDGFRADYLDPAVAPVLSRLAATGASGPMRPSFPTKTFPNHWTLVTGLRPDRHGIVANKMEDPARPGEVFTMATSDPFWWNDAAPIWVEAEKAGIRTATMFWPGADVAIGGTRSKGHGPDEGGTRPRDWQQFNAAVTGEQRVNTVLDWARRPAAIRPRLVTLYFDDVDVAGHGFGPGAPETRAAIAKVDGQIGALVEGLAALGQPANLVIVADHGMAPTSSTRVVALETLVSLDDIHLVEAGPYAALNAVPGREAVVEKALLGRHPHFECWRKAEIPAVFHYGKNRRVPPILCLAEDGWLLADKAPTKPFADGAHGYDQRQADMAALFIANGPAFRPARLPAFDNVDVAPLLRDLIGLPPATGLDGSDAVFKGVLKR